MASRDSCFREFTKLAPRFLRSETSADTESKSLSTSHSLRATTQIGMTIAVASKVSAPLDAVPRMSHGIFRCCPILGIEVQLRDKPFMQAQHHIYHR